MTPPALGVRDGYYAVGLSYEGCANRVSRLKSVNVYPVWSWTRRLGLAFYRERYTGRLLWGRRGSATLKRVRG